MTGHEARSAARDQVIGSLREIADYVVENDDTATAANALRTAADENERLRAENERLRNYVAVIASGMPREDLLAIEREFGEPVDGRLPS